MKDLGRSQETFGHPRVNHLDNQVTAAVSDVLTCE